MSVICIIESPLKMMKNAFDFILNALFVLNIFKFCHDFLVMQKKPLDKKDKINFKIYDITTWLTNSCNTHIAQYLTNQRQPDNETWLINRILQEKYFSSKIMQKIRQGDQFQTSFYFLKMLNLK